MKVTDLIVRATARALAEDEQLLGVRICPVSLTPADVEPLRKCFEIALGKNTFIAVSIPNAKRLDAERFFVSPDKEAAERATFWRNVVNIDEGQHLIYVSVQNHGKAGGLQDTLTQIREPDLREAFAAWCDEHDSGMPPGIAAALRDSLILEHVSSQALCEFGTSVAHSSGESKWEVAGNLLPLLNLARDQSLRAANAVARLAENERVVSRAATGERASGLPLELVKVREAFKSRAEDVHEKMKQVDLTEYITEAIAKKRAPKKSGQGKQIPQKKQKGRRKQKEQKAQVRVDPTSALVDVVQQTGRDALKALERYAKRLDTGPSVLVQGKPAVDPPTVDENSVDQVWTLAQQIAEFGSLAQQVPIGLGEMLLASHNGDGYGLTWEARDSASAYFENLPAQAEALEQRWDITDPKIQQALTAYVDARRNAVRLLLPEGDHAMRTLSTFIGAPLVSLADRHIRSAMSALLEAAAALYGSAAKSLDAQGRRTVLAMDTVEARARSGERILVVSPLHPLWLGQAMGRFDALLERKAMSATEKQLLVRSLSEAPSAPEFWPSDAGSKLQLSQSIGGLVTYRSTPDELVPEDVRDTVTRVIDLYCRSLPHARLGLRVVVLGGEVGPVIEGAAIALEDAEDGPQRIVIHHDGGGIGSWTDKVERAFVGGRLTLGALPSAGEAITTSVHPHLVFHLALTNEPGVELQPATPSQPGLGAGSGLLPTQFTVIQSGLRARTPIDSTRFPALAAFEALHALVGGGQPQCAFVRTAWAVSLRSLVRTIGPSVCWDVVLAQRIGRRPPESCFMLAHERPTDRLAVAIVSREVGPTARALKTAFQALGVNDLRPLVLKNLTQQLASVTSQGVISPFRGGEQVLAASILGMALRKESVGDETFVAHFEGASAATILGKNPSSFPGAFAIGFGAKGSSINVVLGYAALGIQFDVDVSRGQLTGELNDTLSRIATTVELATGNTGSGNVAAREAFNWLVWPALAAAEQPGSRTESLLLNLDRGVECALSAVVYLPPTALALKRATEAKSGKYSVSLRSLDVGTFEALVFGTSGAKR